MSVRDLALYLHVPFCAAKCAYCDFASWANREDLWDCYLNALIEELDSWKERLNGYKVRTIFLGGGTPSLLPAEMIGRLMKAVFLKAHVCPDAEITMEANPGTLTLEKLRLYRSAGINRLSIGAQSMDDRLLQSLGRIHCAEDVREAVAMARDAGFDNINLDLMYALPGQSVEEWKKTLEQAMALDVEHISAYSLIVEEGTPMARRAENGEVQIPDDDEAVEMQRMAVRMLADKGWHRYEISNYAKSGRECRHNVVYWQRGEYLGLGCAAHSLVAGERFENPRSLEDYLRGIRGEDRVVLTQEDAMEETLMLSTRMVCGLDLSQWKKQFGFDFEKRYYVKLEKLKKLALIEVRDGFLRLTEKGLELQNAVVVELME